VVYYSAVLLVLTADPGQAVIKQQSCICAGAQ